jgi:hypothetical protein
MTTYFRLPGLKQRTNLVKGENSRTFYNTDGLINCLPQPGQLRNQLFTSMLVNSFHLLYFVHRD